MAARIKRNRSPHDDAKVAFSCFIIVKQSFRLSVFTFRGDYLAVHILCIISAKIGKKNKPCNI